MSRTLRPYESPALEISQLEPGRSLCQQLSVTTIYEMTGGQDTERVGFVEESGAGGGWN